MYTTALFTIDKTWKQRRCPLRDEWIKMWYIYTTHHSDIKRNEITPSAALWMDLESVIQREVSQKVRLRLLICGL